MAFLEKSKYYLERHLRELDNALEQVRSADDDTAAAIMAGEVARAMAFHDSEVTALQGWASGNPAPQRPKPVLTRSQVSMPEARHLQSGGAEPASPSFRRIDEARLMAMGAVPTLGGLLRMPASPAQLNATASPAARELLRRKLSQGDDGSITTVGSGGLGGGGASADGSNGGRSASPQRQPASPSWQEELRAKRLNPTPSRAAPRTPAPGDAAVNNELAALFAKRQSIA